MGEPGTKSPSSKLELLGIVIAWYVLSVGYNNYNQFMKKGFDFPFAIAVSQLPVGLVYAIPLWILSLRQRVKLNLADMVILLPIVALNTIGHTATVYAMLQKGGGSFAHVIKASEPVVAVLLNLVIKGIVPKPLTALSLIPIVYGVAYAATLGDFNPAKMKTELTSLIAILAMVSNVAFPLRSILRKNMSKEFKDRTNLNSDNEFAVTTIMSFLLLLPIALLKDGEAVSFISTKMDVKTRTDFVFNAVVCGLCFYGYNEMQNKVLEKTDPVTQAVGNTLKRVAIFVGMYLVGEPFPPEKVLGCVIAIVGCLVYGVCDSKKI